jgi:DNA-binding FrmR family transcriptional regulator
MYRDQAGGRDMSSENTGTEKGQVTRKTGRPEKLKKDLEQRLSRIEGQVRGIARMVEDDVYCDDILNQVTAVHSALGAVRNILLENHIQNCVLHSIEKKEYEIINELMTTLKRMLK